MAKLVLPRSDAEVWEFSRRALRMGLEDQEKGLAYLSRATLDALAVEVPRFEAAYGDLDLRLGQRGQEVAESNKALARLEGYIRDFWEVLRRRVERLEEGVDVLRFYGLPQDGTPPHPNAQEEWITQAEAIVKGDADAVAAGYAPMVNPSAAEVRAMRDAALAEMAEVPAADRDYLLAQQAVQALRPGMHAHVEEVLDELRFALRREEPSTQRRIMRSYGARYRYLPGETKDPDDLEGVEAAGSM